MHVAGGADGLSQLVAQPQHALVQLLQALFVLDDAFPHHERIVAGGLDLQIVVERRDALDVALAFALHHRADQLARLARRTHDQPLAVFLQLALEDVRAAVEVLEVRVGDEAVEVLQAGPVLGQQHDVVRRARRGDALAQPGVQVAQRDHALLVARHFQQLDHHVRGGAGVKQRAVVGVQLDAQPLADDVQLMAL